MVETQVPKGPKPGERILSTGTSLFAQFGYNGVSTREIAFAAQVNEVTIYRHFPRKRDLYVAVLESELRHVNIRGDLLSNIAEASDARTALARTFELITKTLMQKSELLRLLQYSLLELREDFDPLVRRYLGEYVGVIAGYLEPWVRKGELRCITAKATVLNLIAIVISNDALQRVFLGKAPGLENMYASYADIALFELDSRKEADPGRPAISLAKPNAGEKPA